MVHQGGFNDVFEVVSSGGCIPQQPRRQTAYKDVYTLWGYNDGSVPFELVIGSFNPLNLSDVTDEMNEEIVHTSKIGQHVSLVIDQSEKWHTGKEYYAVQNLSLLLERAMLRDAGMNARPTEFWHYQNGDSPITGTPKYSVVNLKRINGTRMLEFRLHHPIPSARVFFEFFPYGIKMMDDKSRSMFRAMKNPMTNDKSYFLGVKLLEANFDNNFLESLPLNLLGDD